MLLFLSLAASAISFDELVKGYMDFNESAQALPLDNASSLVFINGVPSLIVLIDEEGNASLETSESGIRARLLAYSGSANLSPSALLPTPSQSARLASLLLSFNSSREPEESECKRLIGIDKFPCSNYTECLAACYTPICRGFSYNTGEEFIRSILDYSLALSSLDSELSSSLAILFNLSADPSSASRELTRLSSSLSSIRALAQRISRSPLFSSAGYYFCPISNYNYSALSQAEEEAGFAGTKLLLLLSPQDVSAQVYAETGRREGWRSRLLQCANETAEAIGNISLFASYAMPIQKFSEFREHANALGEAADNIDALCRLHDFDGAAAAFARFASIYAEALSSAASVLERVEGIEARLNRTGEAIGELASLGEDVGELNETFLRIGREFREASNTSALDDVEGALSSLEPRLSPEPSPSPSPYIPQRRKRSSADWQAWALAAAAVIHLLVLARMFLRKRGR